MKKLQTIVMVAAVAGLLGGFLVVSGCSRRADRGQGYSGARQEQADRLAGGVAGRGIVEPGTLATLAGTLDAEDAQWYLDTPAERYALHFGNAAFLQSTGVVLEQGASVEVQGFVGGVEIAVASITVEGERFVFRNGDGVPLWAGRGRQADRGVGGLRRNAG